MRNGHSVAVLLFCAVVAVLLHHTPMGGHAPLEKVILLTSREPKLGKHQGELSSFGIRGNVESRRDV